jgi:hypothetical protein
MITQNIRGTKMIKPLTSLYMYSISKDIEMLCLMFFGLKKILYINFVHCGLCLNGSNKFFLYT